MMNWLKKLFKKDEEEKDDLYELVIWAVVQGPVEEDDGVFTLWVKASVEEEMFITELYFRDFESAYLFSTELSKKDNIKLNIPTEMEVQSTSWEKLQ